MAGTAGAHRIAAVATTLAIAGLAVAACGENDDQESTASAGAATTTDAAAVSTADADAAVETYRDYVTDHASDLVGGTERFLDAVASGEIAEAKRIYPVARQHFEAIEPVAGAFGDLDPSLDAREGDVDPKTWGGWHYFEKSLWIKDSTRGLEPYIEETRKDTAQLEEVAETIELTPADIATGAVDLLGEVSASKITGEEERYSHTDLWDIEANLEGSETAFEAVAPLIDDRSLAAEVEAGFDDVYAVLDRHRRGDGFVLYTRLDDADMRELSRRIDAVAEPLSGVAAEVGS